jgi:hypothetical protein
MTSRIPPYSDLWQEYLDAKEAADGGTQSAANVRQAQAKLAEVRERIRPGGGDSGDRHNVEIVRGVLLNVHNLLGGEEQQTASETGGASGTTWTLTFSGQTTAGIPQKATSKQVEDALVALSNVTADDVQVTGRKGGPYTVLFLESGQYGDTNVAQMTGDGVGVDEVQTVTVTGSPGGGDFTLTYNGQTTAAIAYDAAAATVLTRLRALSNWPDTEGNVTGSNGGPYTVTFSGATLGETNQNQLTADGSGLTGGTNPGVTVTTGTPGKTGPTVVISTVRQGS